MTKSDKTLIYLIGGPGSGKSRFFNVVQNGATINLNGDKRALSRLRGALGKAFSYITIDTIKQQILGGDLSSSNKSGHPHPEKCPHLIDKYRTTRAFNFYARLGEADHIYLDDHGDLINQDRELLEQARQLGYRISILHVTQTPASYNAAQKILGRQNGYNPFTHIRWAYNCYAKSEQALKNLSDLADDIFVLKRTGFLDFDVQHLSASDDIGPLMAQLPWKAENCDSFPPFRRAM